MPEQLYRPAPSTLAQSVVMRASLSSFLSSLPFCTHRISLLPSCRRTTKYRPCERFVRGRDRDLQTVVPRSVSLSNIEPIVGSSESHRLISTGPRSPMSPARAAARRPFSRPPPQSNILSSHSATRTRHAAHTHGHIRSFGRRHAMPGRVIN